MLAELCRPHRLLNLVSHYINIYIYLYIYIINNCNNFSHRECVLFPVSHCFGSSSSSSFCLKLRDKYSLKSILHSNRNVHRRAWFVCVCKNKMLETSTHVWVVYFPLHRFFFWFFIQRAMMHARKAQACAEALPASIPGCLWRMRAPRPASPLGVWCERRGVRATRNTRAARFRYGVVVYKCVCARARQ